MLSLLRTWGSVPGQEIKIMELPKKKSAVQKMGYQSGKETEYL